jgi:hypothetical protein
LNHLTSLTGSDCLGGFANGGLEGLVLASVPAIPRQVFAIDIGALGGGCNNGQAHGTYNGPSHGGGGAGVAGNIIRDPLGNFYANTAGAGGGATVVTTYGNILIVAGGGGGAVNNGNMTAHGGCGGGPKAGDGAALQIDNGMINQTIATGGGVAGGRGGSYHLGNYF